MADDDFSGNTLLKNKYVASDSIYPKKTSKMGKKDHSSFYKDNKP